MIPNGKEMPSECEACGAGSLAAPPEALLEEPTDIIHGNNCIREYTADGSCMCPAPTAQATNIPVGKKVTLQLLNFHGRKLYLCPECYEKEQVVLRSSEKNLHEYNKNIPDRLEDKVQAEIKRTCTVAKWQDLYSTEREQWVLSNFSGIDDMRDKLTEFIISMEKLEWEIRTKKRAAFDSSKELDARLSKEEREALINDPNFKVPTNSEFKKIQAEREMDEVLKTAGLTQLNAKQRVAVAQLLKYGLSIEEIKAQMKL